MSLINYSFSSFIEILRMTPMLVLFIPLIISIVFQEKIWFLFFIGYVLNIISNGYFKDFSKKYLSNYPSTFRPKNAIQCGDFIRCGATKSYTNIGMPSGHSQSIGFLVGFILYRKLYKNNKNKNILEIIKKNKLVFIANIVLLCTVMYSRLGNNILSADINGCHTLLQTIIGALIGLFFGFQYHKLVDK